MSDSDENDQVSTSDQEIEGITWGEIIRFEKAAENGDVDAQQKLEIIHALDSYKELQRIIQARAQSFTDNFRVSEDLLRGVQIDKDLFTQKWIDLVDVNKIAFTPDQLKGINPLQSSLAMSAIGMLTENDKLALEKSLSEIAKAGKGIFQDLYGLSDPVKSRLQAAIETAAGDYKSGIRGTFNSDFLVSYSPSSEERIASELAENNYLQREILNEMKKQGSPNLLQSKVQQESNFEIITVRDWSPSDVYSHLFALVNNRNDLVIGKYRDQKEEDLERLPIYDLKASDASGKSRGCVIGTVRLLPASSDTVIQFVHKDLFWNEPVINPDLWQMFISTVTEYLTGLQVISDTVIPKPEKNRQRGRYRLTSEEIKKRKKFVKDANRLMKESNHEKTWKQVANELDIPERTLRDWRHNPLYQ